MCHLLRHPLQMRCRDLVGGRPQPRQQLRRSLIDDLCVPLLRAESQQAVRHRHIGDIDAAPPQKQITRVVHDGAFLSTAEKRPGTARATVHSVCSVRLTKSPGPRNPNWAAARSSADDTGPYIPPRWV
jgi:hypothetical protein